MYEEQHTAEINTLKTSFQKNYDDQAKAYVEEMKKKEHGLQQVTKQRNSLKIEVESLGKANCGLKQRNIALEKVQAEFKDNEQNFMNEISMLSERNRQMTGDIKVIKYERDERDSIILKYKQELT